MSRSRKKNPIRKENSKSRKHNKQIANRIARNKIKNPDFDLNNWNAYKKIYDSYDVCDYYFRTTRNQAIIDYNNPEYNHEHKKYKTLEEYLNKWENDYIRK